MRNNQVKGTIALESRTQQISRYEGEVSSKEESNI